MKQPKNKRTKIEWTSYLACAYAEGFCEGDGATQIEQLEAWSFIAINKLHHSLQGFYGRTIANLIENNILTEEEGEVNWDNVDSKLESYSEYNV